MQFLFDNLISTVIVLSLTLLLVSTTLRRQGESTDIANHNASAGRTASVAATLRRDLGSLSAIDAVSDTSFDFAVTLDPAATPVTMGTVRYRRRMQPDSSYIIIRIDETGTERAIGPPVLDWDVALLDASDADTMTPADARRIRVRMVTEPAFAQASDTLDVVWEHVFSPSMLDTPSF